MIKNRFCEAFLIKLIIKLKREKIALNFIYMYKQKIFIQNLQ